MTAVVLSSEAVQSAPPVCLWKENLYGLVSLWDVLNFHGLNFFLIGDSLRLMLQHADLIMGSTEDQLSVEMRENLEQMLGNCQNVGLHLSAMAIRSLLSESDVHPVKYKQLLLELQRRVRDELRLVWFLHLSPEQVEYYNNPTKGWSEVIDRFPDATTDVVELSRCFALSRHAATVFHCIQAIECGLIEFGKFLKVNDPKSGWTAVTSRLSILVTKTKYPDLDLLYEEHFAFLEQMNGAVSALNGAWRNKISHSQGRLALMTSEFSPEVAEEIMIASRSFMRRLATELPSRVPL